MSVPVEAGSETRKAFHELLELLKGIDARFFESNPW
jgi:hypothetical protein